MTLDPFFGFEKQGNKGKVIEESRKRYARKRMEIEGKIGRWGGECENGEKRNCKNDTLPLRFYFCEKEKEK